MKASSTIANLYPEEDSPLSNNHNDNDNDDHNTTTNTTTTDTVDVGHGHMYFPDAHVYQQGQERFAQMPAEQQPAPTIPPPPQQQQEEGGGGNFYGATLELNPQQQPPPEQLLEHQFHYGNPDYHNPFVAEEELLMRQQKRMKRNCCAKLRDSMTLWWSENLYRSFCFGAIDGMLTGASIAAAFVGMAHHQFIFMKLHSYSSTEDGSGSDQAVMVDSTTTWNDRTSSSSPIPPDILIQWCIIVVFTIASCTSDGICMALGHVWSTHILVNAQAEERRQEKLQFENQRSQSKGKLIDMLLAKGMLKIDAMSIADTLEGYPELFVNALIGGDGGHTLGSLEDHDDHDEAAGAAAHHLLHATSTSGIMIQSSHHDSAGVLGIAGDDTRNHPHHPHEEGSSSKGYDYHPGTVPPPSHHHHPTTTTTQQPQQQHHENTSPRPFGRFPHKWSYGKFEDHHDDDPETIAVQYEMKECRKEGFVMMMSFSIFAIIPSIVHLGVVATLPDDTVTVSVPSMVFTINCTIMMMLGIWKSEFFDSNWLGFGLEAVLVLAVSVGCASGIGFALSSVLPQVTLTWETRT